MSAPCAPAFGSIAGTGGIGSGMFFALEGNHTLGRNESRAAVKLDCRDYCKQHIILHYLSAALCRRPGFPFSSFAIGKVGRDAAGDELLREMTDAGIDVRFVCREDAATLFSVCFQYPDSSGGNITTSNGASALVDADYVTGCAERFFAQAPGPHLVLAAPEVPVEARVALLSAARRHGAFTAASVLVGEVAAFRAQDGFALTDLLAVNIDEAAAVAGVPADACSGGEIAKRCCAALWAHRPDMQILVTAGAEGCYACREGRIVRIAALSVPARSTAGAGDAFLSGVLTGLVCGLPLAPSEDAARLRTVGSAAELGTLFAAFSVLSQDAINRDFSTEKLLDFAREQKISVPAPLRQCLLKDGGDGAWHGN